MTKLILIISLLFPMSTLANDNLESNSSQDIGLATLWAMGELTMGGYVKADTGAIIYNNELNSLLGIQGGWRFTKHLKLGFAVNGTLNDVEPLKANLITLGPTLGYSSFNKVIGRYSIDLTVGPAYYGDSEGIFFVEPGLYLVNYLTRFPPGRITWSTGISYKAFENTTNNKFHNGNLNSLNFKLGLAFGSY